MGTYRQLPTLLVAIVLLLPAGVARAQSDVEAFALQGAAPNIMVVIDNSGSMNWFASGCPSGGFDEDGNACTNKWDSAVEAVIGFVQTVNPPDGAGGYVQNARLGLMAFQNSCSTPGGRLVVPIGPNSEAAIINAVQSTLGPSTGCTPLGAVLTDIGRYLAGSDGFGTLPLWGTLSGDTSDASPIDIHCRETSVIFISDGQPYRDKIDKFITPFCATIGDSDGDGEEGSCTNDNDWFDDVALVMGGYDFSSLENAQSVPVHTVGFDINIEILEDAASHSGGVYQTVTSGSELADALVEAAGAVFAGLASFTSATVPGLRTSFSNAFFTGYFEADTADPFWEGHLQAFRLAADGQVLDAAGMAAIDPATGEFEDPRNPYWDVHDRLLDSTHPARTIYTTLGGARTDFTTANVTVADLDVTTDDLADYPTVFGTTTELRDALVDFVYGIDSFDEDTDGNVTEKRSKILGDIFHSNAKVVGAPPASLAAEEGYGPATTPGTFQALFAGRDRVLFVGANDGLLHAIDAGSVQTGDDPATPETEDGYYSFGTGNERFGWLPGMLLDKAKALPINAPKAQYFVDGSPTAADAWFPSSTNDVDKDGTEWTTALVTGMRQGGPGYLALDVTDPTATALGKHGPYPKFLWEFTDAAEPLGESWSQPIVTKIKMEHTFPIGDKCGPDDGDGNCRERWVVIFAAGYEQDGDPNLLSYISDPADASWQANSKGIFVVALDDGTVLARLVYDGADATLSNMKFSFPTTPAVLDIDFDGFADLVYAGDVGGQLWKWDISAVGTDGADADSYFDSWPAGIFFESPPEDLGAGAFHYRSFFFPPTATLLDGKLVLAFGTGERTVLSYAGSAGQDENNRFWVVTDENPTGASAIPATPVTEADLTDVTNSPTDTNPDDLGFYVVAEDGEKFISNHLAFGGLVITTSFSPDASTLEDECDALSGTSFLYVFDLEFGGGFFDAGDPSTNEGRRLTLGGGVAGDPRISVGQDGSSQIIVQRSGGEVTNIDGPGVDAGASLVYWRQDF